MAEGLSSQAWRWGKRLLPLVLLVLMVFLLWGRVKTIAWDEVKAALYRLSPASLAGAAVLALASYLLYGCFDLLGRRFTRHQLSKADTMEVGIISYAFGLSIGSVIGGLALRFRLYSQLGLSVNDITRVAFFSIMTNWLGYLALAGFVFLWAPVSLPASWKIGLEGMQLFGALLWSVVALYLFMCAAARKRVWAVRSHEIAIPRLRMALLQLLIASTNWLLMASCIFLLLEQRIAFPLVLLALLAAAVAGLVARVPAGLGVLETTFFILLARQIPYSDLLAGLLAYRAIYYLLPLLAAALVYLLIELKVRQRFGGTQAE